jgi:hypothetical protein
MLEKFSEFVLYIYVDDISEIKKDSLPFSATSSSSKASS